MVKTILLTGVCLVLPLAASCSRGSRSPPSPPNAVTVPVALNFFAPPGTDPAPEALDIGVANQISAKWSARTDQPWLTVSPTNGETPRNFTAALITDRTMVSVDSWGMLAGAYQAAIAITIEGQEVRRVPRLPLRHGCPARTTA